MFNYLNDTNFTDLIDKVAMSLANAMVCDEDNKEQLNEMLKNYLIKKVYSIEKLQNLSHDDMVKTLNLFINSLNVKDELIDKNFGKIDSSDKKNKLYVSAIQDIVKEDKKVGLKYSSDTSLEEFNLVTERLISYLFANVRTCIYDSYGDEQEFEKQKQKIDNFCSDIDKLTPLKSLSYGDQLLALFVGSNLSERRYQYLDCLSENGAGDIFLDSSSYNYIAGVLRKLFNKELDNCKLKQGQKSGE